VKRRLRRFSATAVLPQKSWAVPKKAGQRQATLEGVLESYLNPPRIESTKGNSLTRRRLSAVVAKIVLEIVVIKVCEIEDVVSIHHKPKLLVSGATPAPAPFASAPSDEGHPLDMAAAAPHREASRSACGIESTWCYDATEGGRIVYKPARRFMPHINGLTPENISVKRDRIVFRYSF